jgi:hypothetical protein
MIKGSEFSVCSPKLGKTHLFNSSHSGVYMVYLIRVLVCIFLVTNDECGFICLLDIHSFPLVKCLFKSFVHFKVKVLIFEFVRVLYIVDITPLSGM